MTCVCRTSGVAMRMTAALHDLLRTGEVYASDILIL